MSEEEFPDFEEWLVQRLDRLESAVYFYVLHSRAERSGGGDDSKKYAEHWEKEIENIIGAIV